MQYNTPTGSLEAYESALKAHRARQAAAAMRSSQGGAEGPAAAAAAAAGQGEGAEGDEYRVPAKLLNNVAVLRFRWVVRFSAVVAVGWLVGGRHGEPERGCLLSCSRACR